MEFPAFICMVVSLMKGAEELRIRKKLRDEFGGGMKEFVCDDFDCFVGSEDSKKFFNSQERSSIVLNFLEGIRAAGKEEIGGVQLCEGNVVGKQNDFGAEKSSLSFLQSQSCYLPV